MLKFKTMNTVHLYLDFQLDEYSIEGKLFCGVFFCLVLFFFNSLFLY